MKDKNLQNIDDEPELSFQISFSPNDMICMTCVEYPDCHVEAPTITEALEAAKELIDRIKNEKAN